MITYRARLYLSIILAGARKRRAASPHDCPTCDGRGYMRHGGKGR